jgi:hypothetical protein
VVVNGYLVLTYHNREIYFTNLSCKFFHIQDESLILTGPKRGLLLLDDAYVEIDLKIRDPQGQEDKGLSKGFLTIRGIAPRRLDKCVVESKDLATRLSTMEVMYAVVNNAVEATMAILLISKLLLSSRG